MLAQDPSLAYVHEPFDIELNNLLGMDRWFTYVTEVNEHRYRSRVERICNLKYPLIRAIQESQSLRDFGRAIRDSVQLTRHRFLGHAPLIKDPIAVFSAEWLADKCDFRVIVVIRHPAAFAGSLKVKNWTFPFSHFLHQPILMNGPLLSFKEEVREFAEQERDIIDQAILLWNSIYTVVDKYRRQHSEWIFVRHEDIARSPIESFSALYDAMGLEFTPSVQRVILEHSERDDDSKAEGNSEGIQRNSESVIYNWKNRLTSNEIKRVRSGTAALAEQFYKSSEW